MYVELTRLALFANLCGIVAGAIAMSTVTGPILFTLFALVFVALGLGWLEPDITAGQLKYLTYLAFALILFVDTANTKVGVPRRSFSTSGRVPLSGLSVSRNHTNKLVLAAEWTAEVLTTLTWFTFGTAVLAYAFEYLSGQVVAYALLGLTVIRMLRFIFSLVDAGVRSESKLWHGRFGPRRLASVVCEIAVLKSICRVQRHCSYRGGHGLLQRSNLWTSGQSTIFGIC